MGGERQRIEHEDFRLMPLPMGAIGFGIKQKIGQETIHHVDRG
jgi:hypothetical protein